MNVISRGIRNAFRNLIRTFSIILILGLSIGLALSMLLARQGVTDKISSVKSSIGNTITISPAGSRGFEGGGQALTTSQMDKVRSINDVVSVADSLNDRLTTDNTSLKSAIDAGSLGSRRANDSGVGFMVAPDGARRFGGGSTSQVTRTFTPPVVVTGVDMLTSSAYGADNVNFTSGSPFNPSSGGNIALVGKSLAEKNNLKVGSTFKAYGTDIKVAGIYDTGNTFANGGLVIPLSTLQKLSNQPNAITSATVTVDSIDNIDSVSNTIKQTLGSTADVTTGEETAKQAVAPLESVKTISMFSLIVAVIAGGVIIFLTMMMIVRERRREIGVMKAIGSSNARTMFQFMTEAVTLTVLGMVIGIIIGTAAASPITKLLVNNSSNTSQNQISQDNSAGPEARGGGLRRNFTRLGSNSLTNVKDVQVATGWSVFGYGFGAAILIAIIGSAVPAYSISRIRPAEVMRTD